MGKTVTVSNGKEFYRIAVEDLAEARAEGFYLPYERGLTIVSNGKQLYEISLGDLAEAERDGFRDLLAAERAGAQLGGAGRRRLRLRRSADGKAAAAAVAAAAPLPGSAQPAASPPLPALKVDDAEADPLLRELQFRQELENAHGWRKVVLYIRYWLLPDPAAFWRQLTTFSTSMVLHLIAFIILASIILSRSSEVGGPVIDAVFAHDEQVEEEAELPQEIVVSEVASISDKVEVEPEDFQGPVRDNLGMVATDFVSAIDTSAIGGGLEGLGTSIGESDQRGAKIEASFFGSKSLASRFVFVIDNSNSMTGGRFETALNELYKTVMQMTPRQRFYVIFYSDTAYPMFHPQRVKDLLPATDRNKQMLFAWLQTVELCLHTRGKDALRLAFMLQPDVIYVLGDGAFTDDTVKVFTNPGQKKIIVHTLGMEVKEKNEDDFRRLAVANGGTYKDVGVSPTGAALWKQRPRKRNSTRGRIWGIALPENKGGKKKKK